MFTALTSWHGWSTVADVLIAGSATALGVAASRTVLSIQRALGIADEAVSKGALEERLDELAQSMRKSARLVEQVSAELDARAATAKRLKEEADTAEALAALHKDQADAVRRILDAELAGATRRIRGDSIKIGVASFIAGGGVTLTVTLLVHPLH